MGEETSEIKRQRKAYLSLWTDFVFAQPHSEAIPHEMPRSTICEQVNYMISPAGRGESALADDAQAAYERLEKGMTDAEVLDILDDFILEDGELRDITDPALCRFYFMIGPNTQFWLEFALQNAAWRVIRKSPLEKKCEWYRYADNQICLPLIMA